MDLSTPEKLFDRLDELAGAPVTRNACEIICLQFRITELEDALRPFAKFACDPPCGCHNCKARTLIGSA